MIMHDLVWPARFSNVQVKYKDSICMHNFHIFSTFVHWLGVSPPVKNMKVSWDYYSQYMESPKNHVPNHQPVHHRLAFFTIFC